MRQSKFQEEDGKWTCTYIALCSTHQCPECFKKVSLIHPFIESQLWTNGRLLLPCKSVPGPLWAIKDQGSKDTFTCGELDSGLKPTILQSLVDLLYQVSHTSLIGGVGTRRRDRFQRAWFTEIPNKGNKIAYRWNELLVFMLLVMYKVLLTLDMQLDIESALCLDWRGTSMAWGNKSFFYMYIWMHISLKRSLTK